MFDKNIYAARFGIFNEKDYQTGDELLDNKALELSKRGGYYQQQRMITDKRRALDRAVQFSYQGACVKKDNEEEVRALINPNRLIQSYDQKIISIRFNYNYKVGDIFEWVGTNTKWIIINQELTELAYFRGNIRKCNYEIKLDDTHKTYASITGPNESSIESVQKHKMSLDLPNYTITMFIPETEENVKYFKRYSKFYLSGDETCWRVEGVDRYSTPGIIQVYATEYYQNEEKDDIENGIVDGLVVKPIEPENPMIQGVGFIKPKIEYTYTYIGTDEGSSWGLDISNKPINIINQTDKTITIAWTKNYSGQFNLTYGNEVRVIVVESLFQ